MTSLPEIDATPEAGSGGGSSAGPNAAAPRLDTPPTQPSGAEPAVASTASMVSAASSMPAATAAGGRLRLRERLRRRGAAGEAGERVPRALPPSQPEFDIAPNDPIISYFQSVSGPVDISSLALESPALDEMRKAGIVLVVPLVSSGELIGLLNLGPRLSERGYSSDDKQLLDALAGYAAPAMRVGQLVRQQEAEARNRERIEQELKVAQLIQQQFLPKHVPDLPSWQLAAFYRPARTVGGDFYDFVDLPDGRVMVICGDVTDKGVPAALVMASTHSLLRATSQRLKDPGAILARVNDLLCEDIPANMFVTCLAMAIEPSTGHVEYANAGHNLPYVRSGDGVRELKATGMPLGLMTGMTYEQKSDVIARGECMLLHSDGLAEAHNARREMFGFDRLARLVGEAESGQQLIDRCLSELERFTGPGVEQEDDITLVALERAPASGFASDEGVV